MPFPVGVPASLFLPVLTTREALLRTQMNLRSSLSEQNSFHFCSAWKVFSWIKLRYMMGKVWRERYKFEKSRIRLWQLVFSSG